MTTDPIRPGETPEPQANPLPNSTDESQAEPNKGQQESLKTANVEIDETNEAADEVEALDPLESTQLELQEANQKWMRAEAELDNFRKRTRKEIETNAKFAALPLLSDLMQVMDNLTRAVDAAEVQDENSGLLEGVKMVMMLLEQTLQKHGCQPIESVGKTFDPNLHEAISMEPSDEHEPNTVIRELQKGYRLHDRVIRPSQVMVSSAKS